MKITILREFSRNPKSYIQKIVYIVVGVTELNGTVKALLSYQHELVAARLKKGAAQ